MIADILMCLSIVCVFTSLIPACISDYKTRTVDPKIWKYAAYIGIPCAIFAFILKLINNEIIIPSLILSIASVLIVIIITVICATIKDPLYNPAQCTKCNYIFTKKSDIEECPKCNYVNAKAILGGADMIAIDIILITSFYISQTFIMTFVFSFMVASAFTIIFLIYQSKNLVNYRIPLIIPITIGYAITLGLVFFSIDIPYIFII
jgi:hypothetical protein